MKQLMAVILLFAPFSHAEINPVNALSVGQGITVPSVTTTVNFSTGWTSENPVGVIYQNGIKLTGELDQNGNDGYGGELAIGGHSWGLAGGYYKRDCEGCEGDGAGAAAVSVGDAFALGVRFAEDLYGVGLVFNPNGGFRIGVMGELNDGEGDNDNISTLGAGLAWVEQQWTFAVDASKRTYENENLNEDPILLSPGLNVRAGILQISLNYETVINDEDENDNDNDDDDGDFWFGIGIQPTESVHLAFYSDYFNEFAFALSVLF